MLGGDHSQSIGSIAGAKAFDPEAKLLWINSQQDDDNLDMALAVLTGDVPNMEDWKCVDKNTDLCYFGARTLPNPEHPQKVLSFPAQICDRENLADISNYLQYYFKSEDDAQNYWISFDVDTLDALEFQSTTRPMRNGVSIEFMHKFFEEFTPNSMGMDFSEVNFEMT